jgi:hypothetical protein
MAAAIAKASVSAAPLMMRMLLVALCATAFLSAVNAADPNPLQDFCVADLSANAPLVNGSYIQLIMNKKKSTNKPDVLVGRREITFLAVSAGPLLFKNRIFY